MITLESRILDGVLFFVERNGRKETLHTPGELMDLAFLKVEMSMADIRAGLDKTKALQRLLESSILNGECTAQQRAALDAQHVLDTKNNEVVAEARQCIRDIISIQDAQRAATSRAAQAARLAETTAFYDNVLKGKA